MPAPSVTYTFSNSTTADATQVNTNFTDLINGMSDGTKDFSINALACAGAATLNGNVTLGNASGDDVTVTGSLASSVAIKTTATYNIGSATLGLLSVYIGGTGSFTTRILAAATASWTFTMPATAGSLNDVMLNGGSGTTSWAPRSALTFLAKTTAYTATATDEIITCDATSAAFTVTLPAAASSTNKVLRIIKIDSSANAVTIDGNSSETINGATTVLINVQYDGVTIACNGTAWYIVGSPPKVVVQYTGNAGTVLTASTTNVDFSTKVVDTHSAFSGTTFTAPFTGWYSVQTMIACTTAAARGTLLYIGGVQKLYIFSPAANGTSVHGPSSSGWYMTAGDTMTIRSDTGGTLTNSAVNHWISITGQW